MKKQVAVILALVLSICFVSACASGLSGLNIGGQSGLSSATLPDPAKVLDSYGKLLQADYAFSEQFLCDAYLYDSPSSISDFMDRYTVVCRKAGYSVTQTEVDGAAGYSIQNGSGVSALLVPNYQGQMLIMLCFIQG